MSSTSHETPAEVALALAKYCPPDARFVLDPCVGSGRLVAAMIERISSSAVVVGIDLSQRSIELFKELALRSNQRAIAHKGSFFSWIARDAGKRVSQRFDCVVMNPPFSARKRAWRVLPKCIRKFLPHGATFPSRMSIEAVFILAAISLLNPSGRLLAILPPSVIASDESRWLRVLLRDLGTVVSVHELPNFTFPGIESRMYLFVFERQRSNKSVNLLNHDLQRPQSLWIRPPGIAGVRLDYGFHSAQRFVSKARMRAPDLWNNLNELAEIHRGKVGTPSQRLALHTDCYKKGFWYSRPIGGCSKPSDRDVLVTAGDILVKRVGRNCSQSFGLYTGMASVECTDCVLILRRHNGIDPIRLLLAIRVLSGRQLLGALIERGTGASYITTSAVGELTVPWGWLRQKRGAMATYQRFVDNFDFPGMLAIEEKVRRQLFQNEMTI